MDAVVNTTNERLDDTTGLSGRLLDAAGPALREDFAMSYPEGCRTGASIITSGHIYTEGNIYIYFYFLKKMHNMHECMSCMCTHVHIHDI